MGQALLKGKFYLIVIGAALVLLLVAACGSDDSPDADAAATWSNLSAVRGTLASPGGGSNSNTGTWVNSRGNASGAPDLAIVNLSVEALADTAAQARADAAVAIDGAIAVLRASGVADPDIQTRFFNISPHYTTVEVTKCLDDVEDPVASPSSAPSSAEAMVRQEKPGSEC